MQSPIREWRRTLHLSQCDISLISGVSQGCISEIETGVKGELPDKLKKLLRKMEVDVEEVTAQQAQFSAERKQALISRLAGEGRPAL